MLSVSSIYQAFAKSNQKLTTTQRFALVTVAALTGHDGWLKLTPAELAAPLGVEQRTAYRLIAWMKAIGFLLPVDVLYDRKQVNHVFICGLPIESDDVDNALPHIQKHFTVTNRQKTLTVIPTVAVAPLALPGLPALAGVTLRGARVHPAVDPLRPRKIVPPTTQTGMQKRVTPDTNRQNVSPMAQNCKAIRATGDTTGNFVPPMTLTPSTRSGNFSDLSALGTPPYVADTAPTQPPVSTTGPATATAPSPKTPAAPPSALTAAPSPAILGTGETRNLGSQRSVTRVDLTHTTPIGGGDGDNTSATSTNGSARPLFEDGVRVSGEKAGKRAQRPPQPTQRSLLPEPDLDPVVELVARWLRITHTPRPGEPELTRDYLQPARELLALTAGDVDDALRRLNARRTRFIAAGYKSARKLSTIGGAILREAEAEQIAAAAPIDPFPARFALPVPPQTTY